MNIPRTIFRILPLLTLAALLGATPAAAQDGPRVVTLDSPAPLVQIKVMVPAGSAADPAGREGLAYLTARMLIEGGFGDPARPVTKEQLGDITSPWGSGARPTVRVARETTTFSMTVPREVLADFVARVFEPMFTRPLFAEAELDRLRAETLVALRSNLRLEQIELLGLVALDNVLYRGTAYAHPEIGTERGLEAVTTDDLRRFYATYYRAGSLVLGVSTADEAVVGPLRAALSRTREGGAEVRPLEARRMGTREPLRGRELTIIAMPGAIASGIHAGFPLRINRAHPDYWPLYIANIWLGAHRDSFGHLYGAIRQDRGYNYGDYSYIEHFEGRPFNLFPPTNTPRRHEYFSLWVRPVAHEYAHHLTKAVVWELENFIRTGLSEEQCDQAKNKARVLYLSLAETTGRLLGYRIDDTFFGMEPGYLEAYLDRVERTSCADVNRAIRTHLQARDLAIVIITSEDRAESLAAEIAAGGPAWGKGPADYQIEVVERDGQKFFNVPESKRALLQRDAAWAWYWLDIPRDRIRVVPAARMFETADLPN
jgi:zinc protease